MEVYLIQTRSRLKGSKNTFDWTNWETIYVDEDINNAKADVKRHQMHEKMSKDDLLEIEYRYIEIDYYPSKPVINNETEE